MSSTLEQSSTEVIVYVVYVYYNGDPTTYLDTIWDNKADAVSHRSDMLREDAIAQVYVIPRAVWKRT